MFKLPLAYIAGVRLKRMDGKRSEVHVRYRWINQNPFRSMYFAVQSMAAELSTGALLMKKIMESKKSISMLVTHHEGRFHKKAVGRIRFECLDGRKIDEAVETAIATGDGQVLELRSQGRNEDDVVVADYSFEWSIKCK